MRKEELSLSKKLLVLLFLAIFLALTIVSAFQHEWKPTFAFGVEFAMLLYIFADSFKREFNFVKEDSTNEPLPSTGTIKAEATCDNPKCGTCARTG